MTQDSSHKTGSPDASHTSTTVTLFVVSAVQFLTPFMLSAVGVALPAIGREFAASAVQLGLIETVYILAFALFLLPAGRMGDIHGRKKVFITGIGVFSLATLLISMAYSIESFIVFRFLQGSGGAMITGTSVAILSSVFPPAQRGRAMGFIVGCVYLGLSVGPVLSGFMVSHLGWRWIFYFAVLVEMGIFFLALLKLKGEWAESRGEVFDWPGTMIYCLSLFCFIYGTLHRKDLGMHLWFAGAVGLLFFLFFESRIKSPILDVNLLLHNRIFAFSNLATLINYAASFGISFYFSLYLQYVRGVSPAHTGMILIIQPVFQAVLSPLFGRLTDRYSPPLLATLGMVFCAVGLGSAALIDELTPIPLIMVLLGIMGTGFGIFSTPNMITVMGSIAPKHYGIASSFVATMRTSGMLLSMTIITLLFDHFLGDHSVSRETRTAFLSCMHLSMLIFCGLCCAGILFSLVRVKSAAQ